MDPRAETLVEEGVVVVLLPDGLAVVRLIPSDACERCGAQEQCHGGEGGRREIEAETSLPLAPGDRVRVAVPGSRVLAASLLLFGVPLGLLLAGVGLGTWLIPAGPWRDPASGVTGVALAALAVPVVRLALQRRGACPMGARVLERL